MRRILLLLLLISQGALAQRPIVDDFFLFETADPVKIYAMFQDRTGYLWLGTTLGLYHFNGQGSLTTIGDAVHKPVTAMALYDNHVYVGYADGTLGTVVSDSVILLPIHGRKPAQAITALYVSNMGMLAGCDDGLYAIINHEAQLINKEQGLSDNSIHSITYTKETGLLIATNKGIDKLELLHGKIRASMVEAIDGSLRDTITVVKPVPGMDIIWAGTPANGIVRTAIGNPAKPALRYKGEWLWGAVKDILVISENHVWVGTEGYLIDVRVKDSITLNAHAFKGKVFNKLVYTKSGTLWAGTDVGISSFSAEFAAEIALPAPYNMNELTAATCDKSNTLWFAENTTLYKAQLNGLQKPETIASLPYTISSLYANKYNELWIGTIGGGLMHIEHNRAVPIVNNTSLEIKNIFSICSRDDHLWISGPAGVDELTIDNNTIQAFTHHSVTGIGSSRVYQLYTDRKNRLWMGTESAGVTMYDGSYHRYDSASGPRASAICSITEDSYGNIWTGAVSGGVSRFDGKNWVHFIRENGLQNMNISSIIANATGQVVIVNDLGVDEWFPRSNQFRHYNIRTSPSIDSTSYIPNIGFRDTAGNVYVPGLKGLLLFKNIETPIELKPNVTIAKLSVFLKPVPRDKDNFAPDENNITFKFDGINFTNFERLHYRYQLEGYNDGWVNVTEEEITFPQLAPGKYRFRVQASLDNDFSDVAEASHTFEVGRPLWKQYWFIALMLITLGGLIYTYIRLREKNLKKAAEINQERMLFEYELLKSQISPHFLFNSLNTLTNLIEENQEHAIDYTIQLSALYRNILAYRNRDTILLAEECKLLTSYMHIQKRRFGPALHLDVKIPQAVLDTCKIIPLALQILVENAIKHNIVTNADPLYIRIAHSADDQIIISNRLNPKPSREAGTGIALQNIQKRYALLTKRPVFYGVMDNEFVVKLPLL